MRLHDVISKEKFYQGSKQAALLNIMLSAVSIYYVDSVVI